MIKSVFSARLWNHLQQGYKTCYWECAKDADRRQKTHTV